VGRCEKKAEFPVGCGKRLKDEGERNKRGKEGKGTERKQRYDKTQEEPPEGERGLLGRVIKVHPGGETGEGLLYKRRGAKARERKSRDRRRTERSRIDRGVT